jgi:hypothetical protein
MSISNLTDARNAREQLLCGILIRDLCSSPSVIRIIELRTMRWAGHVARMWENRNAYRLLVGKPEGNRPLGRSRSGWVDDIKRIF